MKTSKIVSCVAILAFALALQAQNRGFGDRITFNRNKSIQYSPIAYQAEKQGFQQMAGLALARLPLLKAERNRMESYEPVVMHTVHSSRVDVRYEEPHGEGPIRLESWMESPFEETVAAYEAPVESWMGSAFEEVVAGYGLPLESWMESPFEEVLAGYELPVESWMVSNWN